LSFLIHMQQEYGPHKELASHTNSRKITSAKQSHKNSSPSTSYISQDMFLIFLLEEIFCVGGQEEQQAQWAGCYDYQFLTPQLHLTQNYSRPKRHIVFDITFHSDICFNFCLLLPRYFIWKKNSVSCHTLGQGRLTCGLRVKYLRPSVTRVVTVIQFN
jgi:hypothetical protein